jgi:hypothetical protein
MVGPCIDCCGGARLLVVLIAAIASGCASGPKGPLDSASNIERDFAVAAVTWDLNKDGNVTCDEWKQYVTGLFREADANRDGILTKEEYAAMGRRDRLFDSVGLAYFDANADGRLSLSEMTEKPNPAFTLLDKNHDCVLTRDERVQMSAPRDDGPREKASPPPMSRAKP